MKKTIFIVCILITVLAGFTETSYANQDHIPEEYHLNLYKARVLDIQDTGISTSGKTQIVQIKILNKDRKGTIAEVMNSLSGDAQYDVDLKKGTLLSVHHEEGPNGQDSFFIIGYERTTHIYQIIGIFMVCLLLIGGYKGIKAIVALAVTILLVLYVLIPLLLKGYNPIALSIAICTVSTVVTLVIIAGFSRKAVSAILGTVCGITIGGVLAYIYGVIARLTGFSSAEAQMLQYMPQGISLDYRGLLFAGILIGALGAAMDVSISIASALTEITKKDPHLTFRQIMKHGMNIGRDIMSTMTNTLILAYTGGALSMVLVFIGFSKSFHEIANLDSVASEIVRAVSGSIGLLFAVPATSLAFAVLSEKIRTSDIHRGKYK